jgi:hypothetical protein
MNMLPCVDGDASVVGVSMVIDSALLLIQIRDATCTYSICMRIRKHFYSYQTKTRQVKRGSPLYKTHNV